MAGHSKWAQIKRKKACIDSKRGKVFSKIVKEIAVAARMGGADPAGNPRLRTAVEKAKEVNMPYENINRAIQKGSGELPGSVYEEVVYEGYGPGSVAMLIETLTDNKNRTVAEIRHIISKAGGSLGEVGCVSWMFEKKGIILIDKKAVDEDSLIDTALEAGAADMKNDPKEDFYEVVTSVEEMVTVKESIEKSGITVSSGELAMIPSNYVSPDNKSSSQVMRLIDLLEENDDVQNVYTNMEISEEVLSSIA